MFSDFPVYSRFHNWPFTLVTMEFYIRRFEEKKHGMYFCDLCALGRKYE